MQRAFLTQLEDDGTTSCVATGEYRADEGVFAVEFVSLEHHDIDLAGVQLGAMGGEVVLLDDINDADLELDWDEDWDEDWGALQEETPAATPARHGTPGSIEVTVATAESPLPVQMSDAASQTTEHEPNLFRYPFEPGSVRVRSFDQEPGKLGKLGEFLQTCKKARMVQPPILTPSERVREAQQASGAWHAHFTRKSEELEHEREAFVAERQCHARELTRMRSQHTAELEAVRAEERERGGRHTSAVKEWARINRAQLTLQYRTQQQGHEKELAAYEKKLAARTKCAETWRNKRHNQLRATERLRVGREAAQGQVREQKVELRELTTDNDALHAEVGDRIKVSQQRMYEGSRTPFTYKTILRDLQC
jgi:hypothetical protein